jgi:hypothetical protein
MNNSQNNIEVGIWTIAKDGIKASPENLPDIQISNLEIWATTKRAELILWDCPLGFAEELWCDEMEAVNLIQALAIARENQNSEIPTEIPEDIDEQTFRIMMEIIDARTEQKETE